MRMAECAKCGYDVGLRDAAQYQGRTVHRGFCPPARLAETEPTPPPEHPVKITRAVRAFCRDGRHTYCSGVQLPHAAADYYMVCSCGCHEKQPPVSCDGHE